MRIVLGRPVDEQRAAALALIDREAEAFRQRFITAGSGKAMTYMQKAAEADAFLADPQIDPALVPHIMGEVGLTAPDATGVAETIRATRLNWLALSAVIDRQQIAAKQAVREAPDWAAIRAAADVDWDALIPGGAT